MKEYHRFYTGSSITINRLADVLDRENIPSLIKVHKESGRLAGFGTTGDSVELYVLTTDQTRAEKVLEEFEYKA